jgi:glycosyltransferase involved in cell wall biosynthesis
MSSRGFGGAETYSTDVMLSLYHAGIDQCIVMSKKAPRYGEMKATGLRLAPWVLTIPIRPLQKFLLRLLVKREKPDIIHCWMRRAASLAPSTRIPVIGWFGGYYDTRHFRHCTHFVGVTRDIVAHMVKNNIAADRAHFIPTFPDIIAMPPVDRISFTTPKDAKILLTLSRLHPKKGLDTLLTALKNLPDCYVWLAGEGPLRSELEMLAKNLEVIDRVRFLGWRTDRAALLRAADICILPSRYEPFGTVILEAWAAGTPLIACKSVGPAAHVENGVNGLLVAIDDAKGLAEAIRHVLDDEDLRRRLVAQGYATYIKSYTREAVTQQWIGYYRQMKKRQ